METLADGDGTGMGLARLRNRYIERARTLLDDQDFAREVRHIRRGWNDICPRYPIANAGDFEGTMPKSILDEGRDLARMLSAPESRWGKVAFASWLWCSTTDRVCDTYFPREDYQVSSSRLRPHPASRFVCASIGANNLRDLADNIELYFPKSDFALTPEPDAPSHVLLWALAHPEYAPEVLGAVGQKLPMYAGITAHDFDEHGAAVAGRVNQVLRDRTPTAQIAALEVELLSLPVIAARLGYKIDTLKKRRQRH